MFIMTAYRGEAPKSTAPKRPQFNNGHWIFEEQMGTKGYIGFIYVIYDKVLNRCYLGKKQFYGTGQINKGKESDWRRYKSSSKLLKDIFKYRPMSEFEFICIEQYTTKGTLSYSETWSLCLVEAPTSTMFYNTLIEKVTWNVKEKITDRHKAALQQLLARLREGLNVQDCSEKSALSGPSRLQI
jgi:hypothetical protein